MTDLIPVENIKEKIFVIRGLKVLLDRDLAELYGVETKAFKQAVRRNIKWFRGVFGARKELLQEDDQPKRKIGF